LAIGVVGSYHYFLTEPILNTYFVPAYMVIFLLSIPITLLILFAIEVMGINYKRYNKYIIATILILLILSQVYILKSQQEDKWVQAGKTELSPQLIDLQKWIINNTDVNDVFLSTKEIGFALNALTGRKLVVSRRAQNSPFIDFNSREADVAIILYGNNDIKRKELIKKYNIKYIYWDYYWIQSEYYFDKGGNITGWFDPLLVQDSIDYRDYFDKYNVSFFYQHTWLDPSLKSEDFKKLDLLFISPENYYNATHPWKPDLDLYLEEVWIYKQNGEKIAILYKIKI